MHSNYQEKYINFFPCTARKLKPNFPTTNVKTLEDLVVTFRTEKRDV